MMMIAVENETRKAGDEVIDSFRQVINMVLNSGLERSAQ